MLSYPYDALTNVTKTETKSKLKVNMKQEYFNQMMLITGTNFK